VFVCVLGEVMSQYTTGGIIGDVDRNDLLSIRDNIATQRETQRGKYSCGFCQYFKHQFSCYLRALVGVKSEVLLSYFDL